MNHVLVSTKFHCGQLGGKIEPEIMSFADIDECSSVASSCVESNHQVCINTFGSYMCDCAQGFQQDSNNICHGNRHKFFGKSHA